MMSKLMALAAAGIVAMAVPALADGLNPKVIPADAKWVAHIDVDALAKSAFWDTIEERIDANPAAAANLQQIEMFTGMSLPQDLRSITLVGMGFDEAENVIFIRGTANQNQLLTLLQMNPQFASKAHGTRDVITWEDKGKVNYGSFYDSGLIIIGQREQNIMRAIDTLEGKSPAVDAKSALAQPTGASVLIALASDGVARLAEQQKDNPILSNVQQAWITIGQKQQSAELNGAFVCADEKVAQQMKAMAEGLRALGMMAATNENADPRLKAIAPLLPGVQITSEGAKVMLSWTAPVQQVKQLIDDMKLGQ